MNCCPKCFADPYLRQLGSESTTTGNCDFCKARRVPVVRAEDLHHLFKPVIDLYDVPVVSANDRRDPEFVVNRGIPIDVALSSDWAIWSSRLSGAKRRAMLKVIFEAEPELQSMVDQLWTWAPTWAVDPRYELPSERWAAFCNYVTHEQRHFRPAGRAREFLDDLTLALPLVRTSLPKGQRLFRARRGGVVIRSTSSARPATRSPRLSGRWSPSAGYMIAVPTRETRQDPEMWRPWPRPRSAESMTGARNAEFKLLPYPADQIGPPLPKDSRAGRINPAGIPVLYLASDELTAVGEVRPPKGEAVTIAEFSLREDVALADFSHVPPLASPFGRHNLAVELDSRELLRVLGEALSRPVVEGNAELDYIPTQYISEFVRRKGFGGMRYPSAMGPGQNLVLFNTGLAEQVGDSKLVRVSDVRYATEQDVPAGGITLWPVLTNIYWLASDCSLRDADLCTYAGKHRVLRNPDDGSLCILWPEEPGRVN